MPEQFLCVDLGQRSFDEVLSIQRRVVASRQAGNLPDVLLFVEHPPTYTLGRGGCRDHLLVDEAELERLGACWVETDRGGDITFHGPGQLVGYPVVDLRLWKRDVHAYLRALEQVLIESLEQFEIKAVRDPGLTGVWHSKGKLAAIGVRVARWVTSHGFALNIHTDLRYFTHIVPCGIFGRKVSSMEDVLRQSVAVNLVKDSVSLAFSRVFERDVVMARQADFEQILSCESI